MRAPASQRYAGRAECRMMGRITEGRAMKIAGLRTILLSHPKFQPPMTRTYAVVSVVTECGLVGYGEASSNYGHACPTVVRAVVEDVLARTLVGRDPRDIRARVEDMRVLLDGYLGWDGLWSQAIGAVEIALWDILGKSCGQPIRRLLGAEPRPLRLYATGTTMFDATPEWYARYFDPAIARGFAGVKVRVGTDMDAAVARVSAVKEHVRERCFVALDAYWGYTAADALRLARRLATLELAFFEEPSPQYRIEGLRRLRQASPIRIAIGERVYTPSHYQLMAQQGIADIFEPDACISGGIGACMEIAAIARAADIDILPHLGSPTAIGLAANLHWATAAGCPMVEFDIYPDLPARDGLLRDPVFALERIRDGTIRAPDRPGLGIELDEDAFLRLAYVAGGTYAELFPGHERAGLG
jgi:L-alanine-DL-glutamate epimerase-like enolase superfamily enzyme